MKSVYLCMLILIASCSSVKTMRGSKAELLNGDSISRLKVTAELDKQISVEKYRLINIYFRNLNAHWLRVKSFEVIELSDKQEFNVILGNDLGTWLRSMDLNQELLKENQKEKQLKSLRKYNSSEHVYSKFSIPSKLQTNKWVLLQLTKKTARWMKVKIEFIDGSEQVYKVVVK